MGKSLVIDFGDGSKKVFSFDQGNSLLELFQLANNTKIGLEFNLSTDRGPIEIFSYQIDGHGQKSLTPSAGGWVLTLNGTDYWPDHSEFETGPLNDGDCIEFTLKSV